MCQCCISYKRTVYSFVDMRSNKLEYELGNNKYQYELDELCDQQYDLEEDWQVVSLASLECIRDEEYQYCGRNNTDS